MCPLRFHLHSFLSHSSPHFRRGKEDEHFRVVNLSLVLLSSSFLPLPSSLTHTHTQTHSTHKFIACVKPMSHDFLPSFRLFLSRSLFVIKQWSLKFSTSMTSISTQGQPDNARPLTLSFLLLTTWKVKNFL